MEFIMAYETETTQNIPIAERISKAAGSAAQAIGDYADFREQQKKTQAYVDELKQRQKLYAQQYQDNQIKMYETSDAAQRGRIFGIARSSIKQNADGTLSTDDNSLKAAAANSFPIYNLHGNVTGNQVADANELVQKAKNLRDLFGPKDFLQLENVGTGVYNVELKPDIHDKLLNQGKALLEQHRANMDPADYAYYQNQWDKANTAYQSHRTALAAANIHYKISQEKTGEGLEKEGRKALVDAETVVSGLGTRGASSPVNQMAKRAFGGRLLDNMLDKVNNPNISENEKLTATKQVAMTFARNFDATISQGGSSAEFAKHLVPDSWSGSAADFWQKVKGSPEQYLTPDFLKNFANEIKVERDTVSGDIGQMVSSKYNSLLQTYGQDKAEKFKQTALERYKNDSFVTKAINKAFGAQPDQNLTSGQPQMLKIQGKNGKIYNVPADHLQQVLQANPGSQQVQ
jgi:hypothetical protein